MKHAGTLESVKNLDLGSRKSSQTILSRLRSLNLWALAQSKFQVFGRFWYIILLLLSLSGCFVNNSLGTTTTAETNIYNLSRISPGMNQQEVLCIMHSPYSDKTFLVDGDTYDIWFYVTKQTGLDQRSMSPMNLTPLTFKNGTLVGWGFSYYNYLVKRQKKAERGIVPIKTEEPELNLEEALQKIKTAQPQTPQTAPTSPLSPNQPSKSSEPPSAKQQTSNQPPQPPKSLQTPAKPITPQTLSPRHLSTTPSIAAQSMQPTTQKKEPTETEKKKPPLDEEDEEMLDQASQQDFNQT